MQSPTQVSAYAEAEYEISQVPDANVGEGLTWVLETLAAANRMYHAARAAIDTENPGATLALARAVADYESAANAKGQP